MSKKTKVPKRSQLILPRSETTFSDSEILEAHCAQLMEHFDTVTIVVTKHDSEKNLTGMGSYTLGNYMANKAAIQQWINDDMLRELEDED